jgi:uncharacterized OB-fold protein
MGDKLGVKEYRTALRENKLQGLKCKACGFVTTPPRLACRHCGGTDSAIVQLSGKGKITTFTTIFIPPESRRGQTPYLVVVVELAEGPWIMGNIQGMDPNKATLDLIGKSVHMDNTLIPNDKKPPEDIAPLFILEA